MSTTTTVGTFRDIISGASAASSFHSLAHDFPDDSGEITDAQRDAVATAYAAAIDGILSRYRVWLAGDELIGYADTEYDLDAIADTIETEVDFWDIAEAAAEGVDRGSY